MSRRQLLTTLEQDSLFSIPTDETELIRLTSFSDQDIALINQHRGEPNRLGFAFHLCYMRFTGAIRDEKIKPEPWLLSQVAKTIRITSNNWELYASRDQTRRAHIVEIYNYLNIRPSTLDDYQIAISYLSEQATQTDKGIILANAMINWLRHNHIIVPSVTVIERVCAEALTQGTRKIFSILNDSLSNHHRKALDSMLEIRMNSKQSNMAWVRQPPGKSNAKHMLFHINRLKMIEAIALPEGIEQLVHQNRLLKLAREGSQMPVSNIAKFESIRKYATLVAVVIEARATLIDEIVDLHDKIMGRFFSKAKRIQADKLQKSSKTIHAKLRQYLHIGEALLSAKQTGDNPYHAIEQVLPWKEFEASISEMRLLAKRESYDFLYLIGDSYTTLRRYTPEMMSILKFKAAPAAKNLMSAIDMLRNMNEMQTRKIPDNAPTDFISKRWEKLIFTEDGLDRRYYELCVLSELKNALRSGDIWVKGSRQFKDFDDYLVPIKRFQAGKLKGELPLNIDLDCDQFLDQRLTLLDEQLSIVNRLALSDELPDASITSGGLRISPLDKAVPDEAEELIKKTSSLLPHLKITELLLEVDKWTGFTRHFTHLKNDSEVKDRILLLSAILADGINLGLTKMAESCPGTTYAKLSWLQAWHIRDETYSAALAELVNAQARHPFSTLWGDGTTSSSDGQNFKSGGRGQVFGQVNLKYGHEPGVQFYTHISDQYSPYHVQVISAGIRDSTHVLDGLLYHESDLRIEEHYTDTAGFTDHVFALMHLLGFRFAPRIRDLNDKRLFVHGEISDYPALIPLIGRKLNIELIKTHWDEILRLATSIKQGTVTASLMLRKLGSYPRQNKLAVALRELGRIERTLFMLEWMQNIDLRRRVQVGLNKGEARNALARAVFFNRLGEMRDRSFEQQRYRASGLNLVSAAIVLWNTTYLEHAVKALNKNDHNIIRDEELLSHLSPLGWEHINLTGDYLWRNSKQLAEGEYRALRLK